MSLVQDDDMVQAFTADTPDQPLDVRILPRTPWGDHNLLDPHMLDPLLKGSAIDAVPIAQEIPRGLVPRVIVTDKLASYGAAKRELLPSVGHRQHRYLNNRAANSHQCGSRKPVATVIRQLSVHVITPPVVHNDDATHPPLGFP